jgi:hypothetical protein
MDTQEKARQMMASIGKERAAYLDAANAQLAIINERLALINARMLDLAELGEVPDALPPELMPAYQQRLGIVPAPPISTPVAQPETQTIQEKPA